MLLNFDSKMKTLSSNGKVENIFKNGIIKWAELSIGCFSNGAKLIKSTFSDQGYIELKNFAASIEDWFRSSAEVPGGSTGGLGMVISLRFIWISVSFFFLARF